MTTYVTEAVTIDGHVPVTTAEIVGHAEGCVPAFKESGQAARFGATCGIATRRWFQPLDTLRTASIEERTAAVWSPLCEAVERAARGALEIAGITAAEVDFLLVSNTIPAPGLPGLHNHLSARLPLRPDTLIVPFAQLACGAVPRMLALAGPLVRPIEPGRAGRTGLIVVGESPSAVYQPADDTPDSVLVRLLFGDSAGAVVVRDRPGPGTCLALDPVVYHDTDPAAAAFHRLELAADGQHFRMHSRGPRAVRGQMERVWARARDDRPGWTPRVGIIHPGGPVILNAAARILPPDCSLDAAAHSYADGNRGGNTILRILDLLAHDAGRRPADGTPVVMMAPAPGLTTDLLTGSWMSGCT